MPRTRIAAVLLALCLTPFLPAQQPALDTAIPLGEDLFRGSGSTGMVLVVVRGREVFFHGFGETSPGSHQTPQPNSLLRLCSLSKIFATDLLVKMMLAGTVRLDDPLQHFAAPGVTVPERDGRAITLGDLATHTAGLPREVGPAPAGAAHFTFPDERFRWNWLPAQHLRTTPGTAAAYSNIGFDLLGDALQAAAGKPYARLLAERTTTPLGMRETGFSPTAAQCARLLQGAHYEGVCTDTQNSAGSAGVYSTATDMERWLTYLLGAGTPAIPAQNPAAQAVYLDPAQLTHVIGLEHAGTPTGLGLGWVHLDVKGPDGEDTGQSITQKTGGGAGFATYIAINPAHHAALFLAATDGAGESGIYLFKAANNLLLTMVGEPPLPLDPRPAPKKPATRKRVRR